MADLETQNSDDFSEDQEQLLALLLEAEGFGQAQSVTIEPRDKPGPPPLSFAQQRLWFLDRFEPNSPAYNIPTAIRLSGPLDVPALEQSLNEIARRHETLRTTFAAEAGQPYQVIAPGLVIELPVIELQSLSDADRSLEVERLTAAEARQPFDLTTGPLWRIKLLRLSPLEHVLLMTMHHIVSDGWSRGILMHELAALYEAFEAGKPSPLSDLAIQYADFAEWQQQWLQGEVLDSQLSYWRQQLGGRSLVLRLPTDRPRPAIQSWRGSTSSFELEPSLGEALGSLSRQEGVTLFMTLLAAFKVLLYRYSHQDDLAVGTPVANRTRSEIEPLIGFFLNTLVLRTDLSGNPTFRQLLGRVREVTLEAYNHQDIPFEKLVEALQPDRDLSHPPLFQVMFILQNTPAETLRLPGLTLSPIPVDSGTAKFDLALEMVETEQGLSGLWEYNTDLFDESTIVRLTGQWRTLLAAIVVDPEQRLFDLPLLTATEKRQLLVEWNDTRMEYPHRQSLPQLFEARVERSPASIAVSYEAEHLTYRALNQRANRLAHHLRSLGVGPEVLVGLCLDPSPERMVALLGVLKAGGAYLPLGPTYPPERLAFMLTDAQVSILITQSNLTEKLTGHQAKVICLDSDRETIAQESTENLPCLTTGENLVYVIYTSGSTGRPKGVQIPQRALINFLTTMAQRPGLAADDVLLAVTTLSFDISALELFLPLIVGGRVVLASREVAANGQRLIEQLAASKATVMQATPATWQMLLAAGWPGDKRLRAFCGGEALAPALAEALRERVAALWNLYGPTETTIWSTAYNVAAGADSVSIGRPIANTQIYILDQQLELAPIGVPGHLYIGGAGIARGYLNRPGLTAERFIPNPFDDAWRQSQDRDLSFILYHTGDLARYLPDGNIQFLGRSDHQVKIRGFRIELGEIRAALAQHPAVRETIVVTREDSSGIGSDAAGLDKRLVAYFVPAQQPPPASSELRRYLQKQLPDYMVPSLFVPLEALPLTPNGKVDRQALPPPGQIRRDLEQNYIGPRNAVELQLVQMWEDILDVQPIGVTDNFFELGGHSLLVVRLMAHIQERFGQALPLMTLFQETTIERLASRLSHEVKSPDYAALVNIQPAGSQRPFFCVHPVGGNVLCYAGLARYLGADQPFYGLQARGLDGEDTPFTDIEAMAAHYGQALRQMQPHGPYVLGGWSLGGIIAYELARQLRQAGEQIALLALIDSRAPISDHKIDDDETTLLIEFLADLSGTQANAPVDAAWMPLLPEELRRLAPDERLGYALRQAKQQRLVPPDLGPDHLHHLLQVFQANARAEFVYRPQRYPDQAILFKSAARSSRPEPGKVDGDPTLGWGQLVGDLKMQTIPGNHYSILSEPNVEVLAEQLRIHLEQAAGAQQKAPGQRRTT